MKGKISRIVKILVLFIVLTSVLHFVALLIYGLLASCCYNIEYEFKRLMILFIAYGLSDLISMSISLCIYSKKMASINNNYILSICSIILIVSNVANFINTYVNCSVKFLGTKILPLITINIFLVILNIFISKIIINKKIRIN